MLCHLWWSAGMHCAVACVWHTCLMTGKRAVPRVSSILHAERDDAAWRKKSRGDRNDHECLYIECTLKYATKMYNLWHLHKFHTAYTNSIIHLVSHLIQALTQFLVKPIIINLRYFIDTTFRLNQVVYVRWEETGTVQVRWLMPRLRQRWVALMELLGR